MMPTRYLYGTILTGEAVAANNRGDNLGNTTTLQKVFVGDDLHTSVSAEAIRFALRFRFQLEGLKVNRRYVTDITEEFTSKQLYTLQYKDEKHATWNPTDPEPFIDDDLMGFMLAEAAKGEQEAENESADLAQPEKEPVGGSAGPRRNKPKGKITKRQSPLAVGRAVSLRPYRGEISFNCVSGAKEEGALSLYAAELHTTEYQYTFGLNLDGVVAKMNIGHLIDAVVDPPPVAGNHARFAYDFSPASVVFRLTNCHSSKIQNCFEHDEETRGYSLHRLVSRVKSYDVPASELIIAGHVAGTDFGNQLKTAGASVSTGVLQAAAEVKARIAGYGGGFETLSKATGGTQT
jgi:CRISPR-associated protein Cst2